MHDALFADQDHLTYEDLLARAEELSLDRQCFDDAIDAPRTAARIRDDLSSAEASGARGTPTFFVNDRRWTGASDAASLIAGLDAAIERSPRPPDEPHDDIARRTP